MGWIRPRGPSQPTRVILDGFASISKSLAVTIEDAWGGDIVTAAIAHLAHSTPDELLFTATDFNSYVTVSTADHAPRRIDGRMRAPIYRAWGSSHAVGFSAIPSVNGHETRSRSPPVRRSPPDHSSSANEDAASERRASRGGGVVQIKVEKGSSALEQRRMGRGQPRLQGSDVDQ